MRWAGPQGRDEFQEVRSRVIFVVCPRVFANPPEGKPIAGRIKNWVAAGFPDGHLLFDGLLWIVAPDPGCEL